MRPSRIRVGITFPSREEFERRKSYRNYIEWLKSVDIEPVPIFVGENFKWDFEGILLPGGGDVNPKLYKERNCHSTEIDDGRDALELEVIDWAIRKGIPLLSICRGIQILNVSLGGTLYQDIESEFNTPIRHKKTKNADEHHCIILEEEAGPLNAFGVRAVPVNSSHHQAVKELGKGLRVIARAPDGIIEAVIHEEHPFLLGVQWHPERWKHRTSDILLEKFKEAILKHS